MVFVFVEDGTVEVLDRKELAEQYEPFDVENRVFVFHDDDGTWLQPRFTRPNRLRFLGLVLSQGSFELVRSTESDPTIDPFDVVMKEAVALKPNDHFKSLSEILSYVTSRNRSKAQSTD